MRTILLTPGPLTTSDATRAAMGRDWGSRDQDFIALSEGVRHRLGALIHAGDTHAAVPIQGAGTYAVEAAIGTLVPRDGKLLVLVNGAYGRRAAEMAARMGRAVATLDWAEDEAVDPARLAAALRDDAAVTDVLLVHLETTSGLLNPLQGVADVVRDAGRRLLLDAMSSLGAIPIDLRRTPVCAVMASANKCLEGVPGLSYVIAERAHLGAMRGNSASTSLDLEAQLAGFEANRQWRFTPPTHVVAALSAALDQLEAEGGVEARGQRYRSQMDALVAGMRGLGFTPYLPSELQGPVILTLRMPASSPLPEREGPGVGLAPGTHQSQLHMTSSGGGVEPSPGPSLAQGGGKHRGSAPFSFEALYQALHAQGIVLYPGKLTREASFRIGCIGAITLADIERTLDAVASFLRAQDQAAAD